MSRVDDIYEREYNVHPATEKQVGGAHYKDFTIQPVEFLMGTDLDWCSMNIIKYASRHHKKNGLEDVEKIIHYAELLKELMYASK